MAAQRSEASQIISEVAHAEGGTTKGSKSAQMQSELTKQRYREQGVGTSSAPNTDPTVQSQLDRQANFEAAASTVGGKLVNEPGNVTKDDADLLHSREQRAFGVTEKGGLASQAQHQVAENEGATTRQSNDVPTNPNVQSQMDRQANYEDVAAKVGDKLATEPGNITKEDADTLHSREHRAFGHTEKGGLASQAQHQVAENQKS